MNRANVLTRLTLLGTLGALGACGVETGTESRGTKQQAGQAATLPSVSVSAVTATSPVLRSTSNIVVTATVTPVYDSESSTSGTVNNNCRSNNNFCGTGNSAVTDQTVITNTTVTVSNQIATANAADPQSSGALTGSGTAYSGTLSTPTAGTDGVAAVTVTANVSEDVTTAVATETINKTCTSSRGVTTCTTVSDTTVNSSTTVTKTGSGSGTGSYVLDINPGILTLKPVTSQPIVLQGEDKNIHNVIFGGSARTAYTLTDTVTGPCIKMVDESLDCNAATYTQSANGNGTFGPGNDGVAPNEHDLVGVKIACDAPIGMYKATAVAETVDLGGNSFDPINSQNTDGHGNDSGSAMDTFEVAQGIFLSDQTQVVSELPPTGNYAPMTCFSAKFNGKKVSTFPGSLHITATVNTTGPCAGFVSISGTVVTLTLPTGFSFDKTGASPAAHVFVGDANTGFDFHNPPWAEVTSLIPKPSASGQTVTVDLSTLNLGYGLGVIPSNDTIYVRAHAQFSGGAVPADGTQYVFTTSTTSALPGIGSQTSSQDATVTASSACVNGSN